MPWRWTFSAALFPNEWHISSWFTYFFTNATISIAKYLYEEKNLGKISMLVNTNEDQNNFYSVYFDKSIRKIPNLFRLFKIRSIIFMGYHRKVSRTICWNFPHLEFSQVLRVHVNALCLYNFALQFIKFIEIVWVFSCHHIRLDLVFVW